MNIIFYAPFKPLRHRRSSGDLTIAHSLIRFLENRGHQIRIASNLRCRWIFWKPWLWLQWLRDRRRVLRRYHRKPSDIWLTFHSYYKAPDVLGPFLAERLQIPYVIFQGVYATKYRKSLKTWPGFMLNTHALRRARHVFANKHSDYSNLKRLVPEHRTSYIAPGIFPEEFRFDADARRRWRQRWRAADRPVVVSAAMFRADVKTRGLLWLIETLSRLELEGAPFLLAIAGDGREKARLVKRANEMMPDRVRFAGHIPRSRMHQFYSAGDVFAFPGIGESLGMVYLEAQSCGLPVVAFRNAGVPEVVADRRTGLLCPMYDGGRYREAVKALLADPAFRCTMGRHAADYVRTRHDLNRNYRQLENTLSEIAERGGQAGS